MFFSFFSLFRFSKNSYQNFFRIFARFISFGTEFYTELFLPEDSATRKNEGWKEGWAPRAMARVAADNGEFNQASPMLLSALLPSAIKSVYLLPVKFHHGARNVLVITSCKPIGKWFSWLGACALLAVFALACPRPIHFTAFSRLGIPVTLPITLRRGCRSLERRNGIHAINATFHRFIIGPIHSPILHHR